MGQLWFAQAAKQRQVEHLLTFLNSPPVWLTKNGKAFSDSGDQSNLAPENQEAFADFMVASLKGLEKEGLDVDYISPVNEPQWDWTDGGQEGSPFWNDEIAGIVRLLDVKLEASGLNTKIDIAEAGQIEYLYEVHNRPGRSNQIADFFDGKSRNYIGNLNHVSNTISGHSYFTTSPFQQAVTKRQQLAQAVQNVPDLKYWMSEYCILGDNEGEISGNGKDLGMNAALYMARVIHNDLVVAQASAWHWWLAISPYDYKDGLIYISKSETDGDFEESKMLWALGNYSRFIRPGYERVSLIVNDQEEQNQDLLASAYQDPDSDHLVIVVLNSSNQDAKVSLQGNFKDLSENFHGFLTDKDHDLAYQPSQPSEHLLIPARSILTLTSQKP
jgi:O-glycosyl hydrolase